tara:strand:- start:27724 stop:29106 length:1383 start_codon:yes stop_codon:yes gene_type:complete
MKMEWKKLLSSERFKDTTENKSNPDPRSEFLRDTDRIIYSSAFRRMQDKTQVFPIPKSDFVHNRLTHSLEVASVGRSLGLLAGNYIIKKENLNTEFSDRDFGNIIYSACLAHDIGNPPFGHSGEKAISSFFESEKGKKILKDLEDKERSDLLLFEGNALGFRIITNNNLSGIDGGLRLTYATLGAFTKYPWESKASLDKEEGKLDLEHVVKGKFGFLQTEKENFNEIASKLGLIDLGKNDLKIWCRHPLAYLVEAADTICYRVIDIEDTHKLGFISTDEAVKILLPIWEVSKEGNYNKSRLDNIKDEGEKVSFLRAKAINALIYMVIEVFKSKYDMIMEGKYHGELIKEIEHYDLVNNLKKTAASKGFDNPTVLKIELAGFDILGGLIDTFITACKNPKYIKSEKLRKLIPQQFLGENNEWDKSEYKQTVNICDYVARMTDSYALELHNNIRGVNLPIMQ